MRYILRLAIKNLSRNRLRTLVSITAIAISVMVVVFARGLISGMLDSSFSLNVQYDSGHIKIIDQTYKQKKRLLSLNYTVDGFNGEGLGAMISELEGLDGIKMAVPRIKFGAAASDNNELEGMMGWGVDPLKELRFTDIDKNISEGRMIESGKKEVIMGTALLNKLGKKVGDKITLIYNTAFNSFKGTTFKIVGSFDTGLALLNERVFYLPIKQAQRMLYMDEQATELLLITPGLAQVDDIYPGVKELFVQKGANEKYSVLSWDKSSSFVAMMKMAMNIYNIIYIFLILLASFVVINTMIMIIKERTHEIGMMAALGLARRDILNLFLIEGSTIGVIGSFFGAIAGGILSASLSRVGLDYTEAFSGVGDELLMDPVIYPVFSYKHMLFAFILGSIVTALSVIYPARKASRMEPNDALRDA